MADCLWMERADTRQRAEVRTGPPCVDLPMYVVLEVEPRSCCTLGKSSPTELHTPYLFILFYCLFFFFWQGDRFYVAKTVLKIMASYG